MGRFFLFLAIFAIATATNGQSPSKDFQLHVKDLMTASEFSRSGLSKLSPEELGQLDAWVTKHTVRVVGEVRKKDTTEATSAVIETQIEGAFEGWSGETIFKLANGQIWQQSSYAYTYHYSYHPNVIIYRASGCWKMKVEDVDDSICVKRIK